MATVYTISLGMLHNRQIIRQTVPEWEGPVDARIWQDEKDEEPTSVDDELLENHELTAASMGQGVMEGATPQEVSSTSALSPLRGSDRRGASAPITEQESFTPRRSARRASALAIASLTGGSTPIPTAAITASSISPVSPSVPPTNDASADASNVSNLHPPPLVTQLTSPACDVLLLAPKDNPAQSVYIIRTNEQQVVRLSKNCQDTLRRKLNRKRGNGEGDWGSVSIGTCPACTCSIEKGALIYERQVAVMRDKFQGLSFRLVPRIMCPVCFDRLFIQLREQAPPEQMPENEQHIIRLLADVWNEPSTKAFVCAYSFFWFNIFARMSQKRLRRLEDEEQYHAQQMQLQQQEHQQPSLTQPLSSISPLPLSTSLSLSSISLHSPVPSSSSNPQVPLPSSASSSSIPHTPSILHSDAETFTTHMRASLPPPRVKIGWMICFGICSRCRKPCKWKCSRCWSAYYCGRTCQKKDWPAHRSSCQKRVVKEGECDDNERP